MVIGNWSFRPRGVGHWSLNIGHSRPQAGYTLIEILTAAGIFVVLLGVVSGIFITFLRGQRSTLAQSALIGDVQTFLELLEREVRTGYGNTFRCAASDPTSSGLTCVSDTFVFTNQESNEVTYRRNATDRSIEREAGGVGVRLTTPAVEITTLEFTVTQTNVDPGDQTVVPPERPILTGQQGRVTVRIRVCPPGIDDGRCFVTQTTLTSRQYGPAPTPTPPP